MTVVDSSGHLLTGTKTIFVSKLINKASLIIHLEQCKNFSGDSLYLFSIFEAACFCFNDW